MNNMESKVKNIMVLTFSLMFQNYKVDSKEWISKRDERHYQFKSLFSLHKRILLF